MNATLKLGFGVQAVLAAMLTATPVAAVEVQGDVPHRDPEGRGGGQSLQRPGRVAARRQAAGERDRAGAWRSRGRALHRPGHGQYAVAVFQDTDGDRQLKRLFGFAREPSGYSRRLELVQATDFDNASFTVTEEQRSTVFVRLR